jgi:hypothetical protein
VEEGQTFDLDPPPNNLHSKRGKDDVTLATDCERGVKDRDVRTEATGHTHERADLRTLTHQFMDKLVFYFSRFDVSLGENSSFFFLALTCNYHGIFFLIFFFF